jgi:thiamine-monophosphate kinase
MVERQRVLGDLGERTIINRLLTARYAPQNPQFGDDVSVVFRCGESAIVATTDPAPQPVVWNVSTTDFYDWGWLLATINLSDLAAAGATPLGLLTSITLPIDTPESDFIRLLDGIDECCGAHATHVLGGNLKESPNPTCEGTAIGVVRSGDPFSRFTSLPGHRVVGFGGFGSFWSAYLLMQHERENMAPAETDELEHLLRRPNALVKLGVRLRDSGLASSATDASDGLYGALRSMVHRRHAGIMVDGDAWEPAPLVRDAATRLGVDPVRLMLGFGDFGLVCGVPAEQVDQAVELAQELDVPAVMIGVMTERDGIRMTHDGSEGTLNDFDNERFTQGSQFTGGMDQFESRLLQSPLLIPE